MSNREVACRALSAGLLDPALLLETPWLIGERYEILRAIGQGGAGTVFLAVDTRLGRQVALKLFDLAANPNTARFLQEVKLLAQLDHPGVIRIYDSGLHGKAPFYVMEQAKGGTLAAADLELRDWLQVFAKVARTCGFLHARGVVHRDLKPENVLLVEGEPRLADFGVAKEVQALETAGPGLTRTGVIVGTPYAMAPEQFGEGEIGPATDVHALGVMLFERLAGAPPFPADEGFLRVSAAILDEGRPTVAELAPQVPAPLARIAERAIARRPHERFANGDELADALEAWLERVPPWQDPRVLVASALCLLLLLSALVLGGPSRAPRGPTAPSSGPVAEASNDPAPTPTPPATPTPSTSAPTPTPPASAPTPPLRPAQTPHVADPAPTRPAATPTPTPPRSDPAPTASQATPLSPAELAALAAEGSQASDPIRVARGLRLALAQLAQDLGRHPGFDKDPAWREPLRAILRDLPLSEAGDLVGGFARTLQTHRVDPIKRGRYQELAADFAQLQRNAESPRVKFEAALGQALAALQGFRCAKLLPRGRSETSAYAAAFEQARASAEEVLTSETLPQTELPAARADLDQLVNFMRKLK